MSNLFKFKHLVILTVAITIVACSPSDQDKTNDEKISFKVTASAYNSTPAQTRAGTSGNITAWGDTLKPGMKSIAISRDLLDSGLTHNTPVSIEGLPGTYLVNDKMNKRWTKKIDIYMGNDVTQAKEWGKKEVVISFPKPDSSKH